MEVVALVRPDRDSRAEKISRKEILHALSLLFGQQGQFMGRLAVDQIKIM